MLCDVTAAIAMEMICGLLGLVLLGGVDFHEFCIRSRLIGRMPSIYILYPGRNLCSSCMSICASMHLLLYLFSPFSPTASRFISFWKSKSTLMRDPVSLFLRNPPLYIQEHLQQQVYSF